MNDLRRVGLMRPPPPPPPPPSCDGMATRLRSGDRCDRSVWYFGLSAPPPAADVVASSFPCLRMGGGLVGLAGLTLAQRCLRCYYSSLALTLYAAYAASTALLLSLSTLPTLLSLSLTHNHTHRHTHTQPLSHTHSLTHSLRCLRCFVSSLWADGVGWGVCVWGGE